MIGTRQSDLNTKIEPLHKGSKKLNVVGGTCLGFAPRSESFAFEPAVQLRSIPSRSGLVSLRPSANPLSWIYDLILCKIRLLDYWRSQGLELHSEFLF